MATAARAQKAAIDYDHKGTPAKHPLMVAPPQVPEETKAVEKRFKKYVPADK
jgi:hypothetical protein